MGSIFDIYINYYETNKKKCGIKTIVLMQVGSFYEAYATTTRGPDLLAVSQLLNVIRTRRNKSIVEISETNPYMLGFPVVSLTKYLEILLDNYYNVVVIDGNGDERAITNTYTYGTYIENTDRKNDSFMTCIYITKEPQRNGNDIYCCGMTSIELSTNNIIIHEAYSDNVDINFSLDESFRFIQQYKGELIICTSEDELFILNYFNIEKGKCDFIHPHKKAEKLSYQTDLLSLIYKKSLISPIEYLDLENKPYALLSFVYLIEFINDKNKDLLNNLQKPILFDNNNHLILGNNAINQLNILESSKEKEKEKENSLFAIINKTSTSLGERFLKSRLLSPLIDKISLDKHFDCVEKIMSYWKNIEPYLESIKDIERMERKLGLGLLKPYELNLFISSYDNIIELLQYIKTEKLLFLIQNNNIDTLLNKIKEIINYIKNIFNVTELSKYITYDFKTLIFNNDIYPDLDKLFEDLDVGHTQIAEIKEKLTNLVGKGLTVRKNSKKGYFISLSNIKAKILKEKIEDLKEYENLSFLSLGKTTKIFINENKIKNTIDLLENINDLTKKYYIEQIKKIYVDYHNEFITVNQIVTQIDYIKTVCKIADLYNYVKPIIVESDHGYIKTTKLRHPIVERIIDYKYTPHDIELGNELKGMLIYGINSSGKSVLMKAIGLSVVLAQAGFYVPAESYEISPYKSLYTRITGSDDIFRGLSSFSLEMVELNAILKRTSPKTLVIGDEVCRGTEHISGNSLVASTIIRLSQTHSSFMFATHLHELVNLEEIKNITNIKAYHIHVEYDKQNDLLIYDRKLREGTGEPIYGIIVAKHIIHDQEFINQAIIIKDKLIHENSIVPTKTSKYNVNKFIHCCDICGNSENLETHHIVQQKEFKQKKNSKLKNHPSNLIILCSSCHDKIHNEDIVIDDYILSSNGKMISIQHKS